MNRRTQFFSTLALSGLLASAPQAAEDAFFNYEFFAEIHRWCWRVGAAILAMHIAGAVWHHVVLRDNVLMRMWRGR